MPRNKTGKRTAKRQVKVNTLVTVQKLEKDFMGIPAKLAAQLNKEVNALKQKENKLKNAASKAKAQLKNSDARVKAASKMKTAAGKKQLNAAKKAHSETVKAHAALNSQLQEATQSLESVVQKQAKFSSLSKHLNQFEKEWAKNSKKMKARKKVKARKVKASVEAMQPHFQPMEAAMDEHRLNETSEIAS